MSNNLTEHEKADMETEIESLRAQLRAIGGEVVVTTDNTGRCVAVTRQDDEGRILSVIWEVSQVPDWRPIESAPRGTEAILVWCPSRRNTYVVSWKKWAHKECWVHFSPGYPELEELPSLWRPVPAPQAQEANPPLVPGAEF